MTWTVFKIEIPDNSFLRNVDSINEVSYTSFSNSSNFNKRVNLYSLRKYFR